jgi:hypothetical protein
MAQGALRGRALNQDMRQFYENAGLARDLGIAQLRNEEIRADSGFDLEGKAINNRIARDAVQGGATALSTLSNMPNSTSNNQRTPQEQKIEDAFNS